MQNADRDAGESLHSAFCVLHSRGRAMIRRFARPYARAIMDVVQQPDRGAELLQELHRFEHTRKSAPALHDLYANPGIDAGSKLSVTRTIAQRLALSDMAVKVLEVLIRNHRINDLG